MGLKMCHNCGEPMVTLTAKCPKCGIIPEKTLSPVMIGAIAVLLLIVVIAVGLILL